MDKHFQMGFEDALEKQAGINRSARLRRAYWKILKPADDVARGRAPFIGKNPVTMKEKILAALGRSEAKIARSQRTQRLRKRG